MDPARDARLFLLAGLITFALAGAGIFLVLAIGNAGWRGWASLSAWLPFAVAVVGMATRRGVLALTLAGAAAVGAATVFIVLAATR